MSLDISIAVITKSNPQKLARCLQSIGGQTVKPYAIIVIDNDKNKSALPIVKLVQKYFPPVVYIHEPNTTVPGARNRAIAECESSIIGFTDDDCVLSPSWIQEALTSLNNKGVSYVIGRSLLLNHENTVARAFQTRYAYWLAYELKKHGGLPSPFLMDTKNVAYKKNVLINNRVAFDTKLQISGHDSADTDVGFQLASKKILGIYNPQMIIQHEETPTVPLLIKKAYFRGMLAMQLTKKWSLKGEFVHLPDRRIFYFLRRTKYWLSEFHPILKDVNLIFWKKIVVFFLIRLHEFIYLRGFLRQATTLDVDIDRYSAKTDK